MSTRRPRTGLKKPRETERKLREAAWREKGSALAADTDKAAASVQSEVALGGYALGLDPAAIAAPAQYNEIATALLMASIATGEDEDCGEFRMAFEKLKRLGLTGPDAMAKITAMMPATPSDRGLELFVENFDGSKEAAIEAAAVKFKVPASSFDGAVKNIKRRIGTKTKPKLSKR